MFSQSSQSIASFSSLSNLATQKLSSDNFLLWKGQIVPIARGFGVMGHLDGSTAKPPEFVETKDEADKIVKTPNADYEKWYLQDQQVIAWINSTLSPEILAQVIDVPSANLLWSMLNESYAQQSEVRLLHLRTELQNTKRDGKPVDDYLNRMKKIFDQLAIIQHPVDDNEKVRYVLGGLGEEYKMFVTALLVKPPLPAFNSLRPLLLQHELMILKEAESAANATPSDGVHNVLFSSIQNDKRNGGRGTFGRGRGNSYSGRGYGGYGYGRGNDSRKQSFNRGQQANRGHGHNYHGRGILPTPPNIQPETQPCQICRRWNHIAPDCYYRYKGSNESMALTHSVSSENNWVVDSGATNHVTEDIGSSVGENPR